MSDTPRTDERILPPGCAEFFEMVSANFARGLERELNAAEAMIRQQQLLDEENQRLKERVKRLEEAGDNLTNCIACGCNDGGCKTCRKTEQNWLKAKEAA